MSKRREEEGGETGWEKQTRILFQLQPKIWNSKYIYNYYIYSLTNHKKSKLYFQFPFHITLHTRFLSPHHHHKGIREVVVLIGENGWWSCSACFPWRWTRLLSATTFNFFFVDSSISSSSCGIFIKHASTFSSVFVFDHSHFSIIRCTLPAIQMNFEFNLIL